MNFCGHSPTHNLQKGTLRLCYKEDYTFDPRTEYYRVNNITTL